MSSRTSANGGSELVEGLKIWVGMRRGGGGGLIIELWLRDSQFNFHEKIAMLFF